MGFLSKLFGKSDTAGLGIDELARRLGTDAATLEKTAIAYRELRIAKRDGSTRLLHAPGDSLKTVQRQLLRKVLAKLSAHPAATGFEKGQSIVTNAAPHVGAKVLLKMDIRDFFTNTTARRVRAYFVGIGWSGAAADLIAKLTTHKGCLPQGAPTSPRISNLVNAQLDARLFAVAIKFGFVYTRYADDMTFSLRYNIPGMALRVNPKTLQREWQPASQEDQRAHIAGVIRCTKEILRDYGYTLHQDKKLQIRRRHDRMLVTGVVVNEKLDLPRETRRKLRAVRHHLKTGRTATLNETQLKGWDALQQMIVIARPQGTGA